RVVTMAVPPTLAVGQGLFAYDQLRRSWYTYSFQLPLADDVVRMDGLACLDRLWADWSPGYDGAEDLARVKESLRDPANVAAALAHYPSAFEATRTDPALDADEAAANRL